MESVKETIFDIIRESKLRTPFFQRNYVWDKDMWDVFLDSLREQSSRTDGLNYFMGCLIFQADPEPYEPSASEKHRRVIIDGQQRLTTMFLLAKAICGTDNPNEFDEKFVNFEHDGKSLSLGHKDSEVFSKIIKYGAHGISVSDNENKIHQCYEYFIKKKKSICPKLNLDIFDKIEFAVIYLNKDEDEQQVFDRLNTLGTRLSVSEVVKNCLFRRVNRDSNDEYKKYWKNLFEYDNYIFWGKHFTGGSNLKSNLDVFLQSFFSIYTNENKQCESIVFTKSNKAKPLTLVESFKSLFKKLEINNNRNNRITFLESMRIYANIYRENIDCEAVNINLSVNLEKKNNAIKRMNHIIVATNIRTVIPCVLWILHNIKDNNKEQENIIKCLENYIMRRSLGKQKSPDYYKIFNSFIKNRSIARYKDLNKEMYSLSKDGVSAGKRLPDKEMLDIAFSGANGQIVPKVARAGLYFIELHARTSDVTVLLPLAKYSLEHILPKKWDENWKNFPDNFFGIDENKTALTNKYVRAFGNLTIITEKLNSEIQNANWQDKKTGINGKKGLSEGAKGLVTLEKFFGKEEWNNKVIDDRKKYLLEMVEEIWPMPTRPESDEG